MLNMQMSMPGFYVQLVMALNVSHNEKGPYFLSLRFGVVPVIKTVHNLFEEVSSLFMS